MKNLVFTFLLLILVAQNCISQDVSSSVSDYGYDDAVQIVDSLNEVAFKTKRFDLKKSLIILSNAAVLANRIKYKKGIATNLLYEGGIYQQNGFEQKALTSYYKALSISKSIHDTYNVARVNQQLANAFQASGKIHEAETLSKTAMNEYMRLGRRDEVVNTKNSLGSILVEQKDFVRANEVLQEALRQGKNIHYRYGIKKAYYNLGLLNTGTLDFGKAREYFDLSFRLDSVMKDHYGIALTKIKLAYIANHEARFDEAIVVAGKALEHARSISALQLVSQAIENIIVSYRKKNNLYKVVECQEELLSIKKQLSKQEKLDAVNLLDILNEQHDKQLSTEREAMIMQQKNRRQFTILVIIACALVTLSILAYLWYTNYRRAKLYGVELAHKNLQIEKNSLSLELLNKAISKQNQGLQESNYMKDKLLSIISHDLRHPLVNTKGILELINVNLINADETKQLFQQLESQYMKSLTLLDNLLFWMRGRLKGEGIRLEPVEIKQLVIDTLEDHTPPLQNKGIKVHNKVKEVSYVLADKGILKIIFRNLLSTAIRFTPEKGEIIVDSCEENGLVIVVKDSGIEMDEDTLKKISDKQFFTTEGFDRESGTGLDLMLCQNLIEKQNGKLIISSERGKGSTFSVRLPAGSAD